MGAPGRVRWRGDGAVAAVFLLGLALSLLLALRSQVGGDQLDLLARGWLLIAHGQWVPFGNPASSGGAVPGGVTALLVAAPLLLWRHHRAAVLAIVVAQAGGFLLLDRWLRAALGARGRLLFAVFYWLDPWRVMLSGFLWNPGYMVVAGALHAWTSWRLRERPRFLASFVHVLVLAIAFQVHPSVVLLAMASVLLIWSDHLRLRWSAAALAALVAALSLVPWVLAVRARPALLPVSAGFPGRGILLVTPFLRGVVDWLRHASLFVPPGEVKLDFGPVLGAGAARTLHLVSVVLLDGVAVLSVALPVLANLWLWRPLRRGARRDDPAARGTGAVMARLADLRRVLRAGSTGRGWVRGYVRVCFVAALVVYALAPTTVMWWQGVVLLHAAVLALVLWAEPLLRLARRRRWGRAARAGVWAWGATAAALVVLLAIGGRRFRCGGADQITIPLAHDHAMLHELSIAQSCPILVYAGGWWPDVLPEPPGAEPTRIVGAAPRTSGRRVAR